MVRNAADMQSGTQEMDWLNAQESQWNGEGVGSHYYQYYLKKCDVSNVGLSWRGGRDVVGPESDPWLSWRETR